MSLITSINDAHNFFLQEQTETDVTITCLKLTLTAESVPKAQNLTIYANKLTIKGRLELPGENVKIHSQFIVADDDAVIDVSGKDGSNAPDFKAPFGTQTGDAGGVASNGGNVIIIAKEIQGNLSVKSNGGMGGNGQPGSDGEKGKDAAPVETRADCNSQSGQSGHKGNKGGTGGNAGKGGKGMPGGNAGKISINLVNLPVADNITLTANGGKGGMDGAHGAVGQGGAGGLGQYDSEWDDGPGDRRDRTLIRANDRLLANSLFDIDVLAIGADISVENSISIDSNNISSSKFG